MHQQAFEGYEEYCKKRDGKEWEVPLLRKKRRSAVGFVNQYAPCVPDLGTAEWMHVFQAILLVFYTVFKLVFKLVFMESLEDQNISVCAQGTENMPGGAMLAAFCFLTGVWTCWNWRLRLAHVNQSKDNTTAKKRDAAANACRLFHILFFSLCFVFLVELALHTRDQWELETCRYTLSTDKQDFERKLQHAQVLHTSDKRELETCRDTLKKQEERHYSGTQNLERKLQHAQEKRDTCLEDMKKSQWW